MAKPMNYRLKTVTTALLGVILAACASQDRAVEAPSYATVYDGDRYRVICTESENREIFVRYNALDTFYRADGSEKTRDEFCRENALGAGRR